MRTPPPPPPAAPGGSPAAPPPPPPPPPPTRDRRAASGPYLPRRLLAGAPLVALATFALVAITSCGGAAAGDARRQLTDSDRREIAGAVEQRLREATDLRAGGDVVERMLSLYPDTGRVVSASGGQVMADRDSLAASVEHFWEYIGQNMRSPEWRWGPMQVDVLGPDAAVVTASYRIPHITPRGEPHVIGGAWTAVFARRSGRWVVVQEHLSDAPGPLSPTP